jgi:hypothetical protein
MISKEIKEQIESVESQIELNEFHLRNLQHRLEILQKQDACEHKNLHTECGVFGGDLFTCKDCGFSHFEF